MKDVQCIKNIRTLYQSLICEIGGDKFKYGSPSSQNMENKFLKQFGDEVCILKRSTRQGNTIFSKTLSISDAFHKENSTTKSKDVQLLKKCSLGALWSYIIKRIKAVTRKSDNWFCVTWDNKVIYFLKSLVAMMQKTMTGPYKRRQQMIRKLI